MELGIPLFDVTADSWIIALLSFCIHTEQRWFHNLHEFMTFQEAYLTSSARTGPDGTQPADQRVATLHSPPPSVERGFLCVSVCLGVWLCRGDLNQKFGF